jgi:hypothetical protein
VAATSAADLVSNASGSIGRAPAAAFRSERLRFRTVWAWLRGALPTGSVTSSNRQPAESDVVHDHMGLGQHQIVAISCIVARIRARHVKHVGASEVGQTVGAANGPRVRALVAGPEGSGSRAADEAERSTV